MHSYRWLIGCWGTKLADGSPHAVMADPEVQRVYMGIEI